MAGSAEVGSGGIWRCQGAACQSAVLRGYTGCNRGVAGIDGDRVCGPLWVAIFDYHLGEGEMGSDLGSDRSTD